jgi:hypothetical protein
VQFPPEFVSGDGEGMDMQLPNKVYNQLKQHSQADTRPGHKHSEKKEHSTAVRYFNFFFKPMLMDEYQLGRPLALSLLLFVEFVYVLLYNF